MARNIAAFTIMLTITVSSFTTVLLAVERYIACVHSFRLHRIMNEKNALAILAFIWLSGLFCATATVIRNQAVATFMVFDEDIVSKCVISFVIILSTLVRPRRIFGKEAELIDYVKRQIKIAVVAGIVAFAFAVCMLPTGCLFLYDVISGILTSESLRSKVSALTFANTIVNPMIYGFGIADTRRSLIKTLKTIFNRCQ